MAGFTMSLQSSTSKDAEPPLDDADPLAVAKALAMDLDSASALAADLAEALLLEACATLEAMALAEACRHHHHGSRLNSQLVCLMLMIWEVLDG